MARNFNGTSDRISLGSPDFLLGAAPITTVSVWANSATVSGTQQTFWQESGSFLFGIRFSGTAIQCWTNAGGVNSSVTAVANTWYQIVWSIGGISLNSFNSVNGIVTNGGVGSGVLSGGGAFAANIGMRISSSEFFNGRLGEVAVWNGNLTKEEALALNRGARPWQIRPQGLRGWWRLQNGGSAEVDYSLGNHNGVPSGTSLAPDPPLLGPPYLQIVSPLRFKTPTAAAPTTVQRRTLDNLGTRAGSRHIRVA